MHPQSWFVASFLPLQCCVSFFEYCIFFLLSSCFFLIFLFSIKLFTKSKSWLSSFNFSSNRLFHQVSFFVFGSSLAPTNSVTYAAAAYIVLFSSVRFPVSIFFSTQFTLFTAHFIFAFGIPRNDLNCCFSFLYTKTMSWSNHFHLLVKFYHV